MGYAHDESRPTHLDFGLYADWVRSGVPDDMPVEAQAMDACLRLMSISADLIAIVRRSSPLDVPRIVEDCGFIVSNAIWLLDICGWSLPDPDVLAFERVAVADFRDQDLEAAILFGSATGHVGRHFLHGREWDGVIWQDIMDGLMAINRLLVACGSRISTAMRLNVEHSESAIVRPKSRGKSNGKGAVEGPSSKSPEFMTVDQARAWLLEKTGHEFCRVTLYRWTKDGVAGRTLDSVRVGGRIMIKVGSLERFTSGNALSGTGGRSSIVSASRKKELDSVDFELGEILHQRR